MISATVVLGSLPAVMLALLVFAIMYGLWWVWMAHHAYQSDIDLWEEELTQ